MTSKGNQRLKRKNNFPDTKMEPNLKALKKEDIIAHFNTLQANFNNLEKKNKDLEEENKTHIEAISLLEETVKILQEQANKRKKDKETKEMATDTSELKSANTEVYLCGDCDYVANCMHDFNDHTHSPEGFEDYDDTLFTCNFCDESFKTLSEVMKHKKDIHTSSVQHCKQYLENDCSFGENCWFLHCESFKNSDPSFKCNLCERKFRTQNVLREHMKIFHLENVSNCKNENECKFGPRKCWFIHQENIDIAYKKARSEVQNNVIYDME